MEAIPPEYDEHTKERLYKQEWLEYFHFLGREAAIRDHTAEWMALTQVRTTDVPSGAPGSDIHKEEIVAGAPGLGSRRRRGDGVTPKAALQRFVVSSSDDDSDSNATSSSGSGESAVSGRRRSPRGRDKKEHDKERKHRGSRREEDRDRDSRRKTRHRDDKDRERDRRSGRSSSRRRRGSRRRERGERDGKRSKRRDEGPPSYRDRYILKDGSPEASPSATGGSRKRVGYDERKEDAKRRAAGRRRP